MVKRRVEMGPKTGGNAIDESPMWACGNLRDTEQLAGTNRTNTPAKWSLGVNQCLLDCLRAPVW